MEKEQPTSKALCAAEHEPNRDSVLRSSTGCCAGLQARTSRHPNPQSGRSSISPSAPRSRRPKTCEKSRSNGFRTCPLHLSNPCCEPPTTRVICPTGVRMERCEACDRPPRAGVSRWDQREGGVAWSAVAPHGPRVVRPSTNYCRRPSFLSIGRGKTGRLLLPVARFVSFAVANGREVEREQRRTRLLGM